MKTNLFVLVMLVSLSAFAQAGVDNLPVKLSGVKTISGLEFSQAMNAQLGSQCSAGSRSCARAEILSISNAWNTYLYPYKNLDLTSPIGNEKITYKLTEEDGTSRILKNCVVVMLGDGKDVSTVPAASIKDAPAEPGDVAIVNCEELEAGDCAAITY